MSSSRSTGCPPREARGVCPPLPRGDTRKTITECHPREVPRDVALCPSHTALYHAVCPSHTARLSRCPSHTAQYRGVSVTHHRVLSLSVTHRVITRCVRHTPSGCHCAISRGVQSYTHKTITECPPRQAQGVLLAKNRCLPISTMQ